MKVFGKTTRLIVILISVCLCLFALIACDEEHIHEWSESVEMTAPTCERTGTNMYVCLCGETKSEEIPALGHEILSHEAKTETCEEIGWNAYETCARENCKYTTYVEIPAKGHDLLSFESKAVTCEEIGWSAYVACQRENCSYTTYAEIEALGHDECPHEAKEAKCTEIGWLAYVTCNRTGCEYTTYEELPVLGHNKEFRDEKLSPTCEKTGLEEYICTRCGHSHGNEVIPALGHDKETVLAKEASCESAGWAEYEYCKRDHCTYTTKVEIKAFGHSWNEGEKTSEGIKYTCQTCGGVKVETIEEHTHVFDEGQVTKEPTCDGKGVLLRTCICGETKEEEINSLGHDLLTHAKQDATCEKTGWEEYKACQREHCTYIENYAEIPLKEHTRVQGQAVEATCTEKGMTAGEYCSVCGKVFIEQEEISAKGHSWGDGVKDGNVIVYTCERCGQTKEEECKEHIHVFDNGKTTKAPTCENKGTRTYSCTATLEDGEECPYAYEEEIEPLGHDIEQHETIPATCTEAGYEAYETCKRNGCEYTTYEEIQALGHDTEQHAGKPATCTEAGYEAYETCKRNGCGYTTYEEIPALGHDTEQHAENPATCTEAGYEAYETCKRNGCGYTTYEEIQALGHDIEQHAGKPATCTEAGYEAYETCKRNGCGYTTYEEIQALGHDIEQHAGKPATCTEAGYEAYETCKRGGCGYTTYEESKAKGHTGGKASCESPAICTNCGNPYGEATGHVYVNGICKNCNLPSTDGVAYELSSDGTYYICTGRKSSGYRFIVIADEIDGIPVTQIKEKAFARNYTLVSVTIGKNITKIGANAFYECYNLVEVYNKSSIKITAGAYSSKDGYMGTYAKSVYKTAYTSKIKTDGNGFITYQDGEDVRLIGYVGTQTVLTLPSGITKIEQGAFAGCEKVTEIVLSDTVKTIGVMVFMGCEELKSVTIGVNVKEIGNYIFYGLSNIEEVIFKAKSGWTITDNDGAIKITETQLSDKTLTAEYLTDTYQAYTWTRS